MSLPPISLVIATFDEGPDLEATVALARASDPAPAEIIVVDDWSQEPVEARLAAWKDVRVVRPPERLGAGPAKTYGANMATGEVIVLMDSHLRFTQDWLRVALDAYSRFPNAMLCPVSTGFENRPKFIGAGSRFSRTGILGLDNSWLQPRSDAFVDLVPCLLGGCYFIPRRIWEGLEGINPNFDGWGYEEQDLSLRGWACGYEVRCMGNLRVAHNYNRDILDSAARRKKTSFHATFNAMVLAATIFEEGAFEKHFLPFIRFTSEFGNQAVNLFKQREPQIQEYRRRFQQRRVFDDFELQALTGFEFPSMETNLLARDVTAHLKEEVKEQKEDRRETIEQQEQEIRERMSEGSCAPCSASISDPSKLPEV